MVFDLQQCDLFTEEQILQIARREKITLTLALLQNARFFCEQIAIEICEQIAIEIDDMEIVRNQELGDRISSGGGLEFHLFRPMLRTLFKVLH